MIEGSLQPRQRQSEETSRRPAAGDGQRCGIASNVRSMSSSRRIVDFTTMTTGFLDKVDANLRAEMG